jgi:hypothetical protein
VKDAHLPGRATFEHPLQGEELDPVPFEGPASRAFRILAHPGRIVGVREGTPVAADWTGKGDGVAVGELEPQVAHLLPEWAKPALEPSYVRSQTEDYGFQLPAR